MRGDLGAPDDEGTVKTKTAMDAGLRARRDQILRQMSAVESPRILFLFVAIIVLFDVGYALIGIFPPVEYYISDVVQSVVLLAAGILITRGVIPARWAPAAFASAIVVNNIALNIQYTLVGYGAVGVIMLAAAAYGAITLMWRPFLLSAGVMAVITSYTLLVNDPENGPGWIVTMLTALGVSGVILYGRQRGALQLAEANREIEELATRDELTGLLNRRGLVESGRALAAVAARRGDPLFVVFVDIDGLKGVNDRFGHDVGDLVIQRSADALQSQCRTSDLLCRWGGDEFVVVGLGDPPGSADFQHRMEQAVDTTGLDGCWAPQVSVGVSASDTGAKALDDLIHAADAAMYRARGASLVRGEQAPIHPGR